MNRNFNKKPNWCRDGNDCIYLNCPFRHETCKNNNCQHHKEWIKRGMKSKNLETGEYDGCMYDHRDPKTLVNYVRSVPMKDLSDIYSFGVDNCLWGDMFDITDLSKPDRKLLKRSLNYAGFEFDIHVDRDENGEATKRILEVHACPKKFQPIDCQHDVVKYFYGLGLVPHKTKTELFAIKAMHVAEYERLVSSLKLGGCKLIDYIEPIDELTVSGLLKVTEFANSKIWE